MRSKLSYGLEKITKFHVGYLIYEWQLWIFSSISAWNVIGRTMASNCRHQPLSWIPYGAQALEQSNYTFNVMME